MIMGAMALSAHWIPEDDVLLRNAVEAGASLESLAKGAVQFSRRFTVQELQHRWFCLLYDPVVSVEASVRMAEVERWGVTNQLRPNNLGVKDIGFTSGKRKRESIRKCYYSMRKRICNEPFDMMGTSLVSGLGNELLSADSRIVNPATNNFEAQGLDHNIRPHSFPHIGPLDSESTGNGGTPSFTGVQNHEQRDHGQKNVPGNLSHGQDENISLNGNCSEIPGFVQSKDLPLCNLFEDEKVANPGNTCSEFAEMPIWHSSQETAEADMPIHIGDGDLQIRDEFMNPPAANESDALEYGSVLVNPKLETPLACDIMVDMSSSTQEYLEVLFDLSDDEGILFMDTDGKEAIEKSYIEGLSSLLLESPNQCELSCSGLGEVAVAEDGLLIERTDIQNNKDLCYQQEVADAQVTTSGSTMKLGPEYRNGVIFCTLNTEDPEIPSNDDVFILYKFPSPIKSSGTHWGLHDTNYQGSSSVKNFLSTFRANGDNQKDSYVPSENMEAFHPSNACLKYCRDRGLKFELPESSVQHATLREARNSDCPNQVNLSNVHANNFISGVVKAGPGEMGKGKNVVYTSFGPCPDKHDRSFNIHQNFQKESIRCQSGVECIAEIPNNGSTNTELSPRQTDVPLAIDQSLLSEQEELCSDNESGVPYFSDVEAMILDMDLCPDEFDFYTNPEVQRYHHEETKRTIIRLEQGADAFTQRTLASHGAFAYLHGRYSKYFIKKPEVLLGRATDDIEVDIDLGREKNGGKISRRQATMKLDVDGVFRLKNLGKGPIYVNDKEIAHGQGLGLSSGCLIEIRGMAYLFETNHKMIKQYLDSSGCGGSLADHKLSE